MQKYITAHMSDACVGDRPSRAAANVARNSSKFIAGRCSRPSFGFSSTKKVLIGSGLCGSGNLIPILLKELGIFESQSPAVLAFTAYLYVGHVELRG